MGLFGEFTTITRVRGVIAAATCSAVAEKPFSSRAETTTGTAPHSFATST